jgi:hypothetical protein
MDKLTCALFHYNYQPQTKYSSDWSRGSESQTYILPYEFKNVAKYLMYRWTINRVSASPGWRVVVFEELIEHVGQHHTNPQHCFEIMDKVH